MDLLYSWSYGYNCPNLCIVSYNQLTKNFNQLSGYTFGSNKVSTYILRNTGTKLFGFAIIFTRTSTVNGTIKKGTNKSISKNMSKANSHPGSYPVTRNQPTRNFDQSIGYVSNSTRTLAYILKSTCNKLLGFAITLTKSFAVSDTIRRSTNKNTNRSIGRVINRSISAYIFKGSGN